MLERVQRVWTSDMTDAVSRQQIQRWTTQLVAPEYAGAHVSAPTSHTTHRTLSLDFRAATALFGAFGIEWDLTEASPADLESLASWIERFKRFRPLLHGGRMVRPESSDPAVLLHGVVGPLDGSLQALVAHVQLDESAHNRGVQVRVPGLTPSTALLADVGGSGGRPGDQHVGAPVRDRPDRWVRPVSGGVLASRGFWMPRMRPETVTLVQITPEPTLGGLEATALAPLTTSNHRVVGGRRCSGRLEAWVSSTASAAQVLQRAVLPERAQPRMAFGSDVAAEDLLRSTRRRQALDGDAAHQGHALDADDRGVGTELPVRPCPWPGGTRP